MKDKQGVIAGLGQQLGLPLKQDISDKLDIQFQPAGNRAIRPEEFFGRDNLGRIEGICGEKMQPLGYQVHER